MANNYRQEKQEKEKGFFQHMMDYKVNVNFDSAKPITYVPNFIFLAVLAIIYIGNNYYANQLAIKTTKLEKEVTTLRKEMSNLEYQVTERKRSKNVAELAELMNLKENSKPLIKID